MDPETERIINEIQRMDNGISSSEIKKAVKLLSSSMFAF
jgi:hypothetical protein